MVLGNPKINNLEKDTNNLFNLEDLENDLELNSIHSMMSNEGIK